MPLKGPVLLCWVFVFFFCLRFPGPFFLPSVCVSLDSSRSAFPVRWGFCNSLSLVHLSGHVCASNTIVAVVNRAFIAFITFSMSMSLCVVKLRTSGRKKKAKKYSVGKTLFGVLA